MNLHKLAFWRAGMARRLFAWFGLVIIATMIAVMVTSYILYLSGITPSWKHEMKRGEQLIAMQLARSWDEPQRRELLLDDIQRSLGAYVRLDDARGAKISQRGDESCCIHSLSKDITLASGEVVGRITICPVRDYSRAWLKLVVTLLVVSLVLWVLAWWVARGLGRPLTELAQVAQELGQGDFSSRAKVAQKAGGEITVLAQSLNEMAERIELHIKEQRTLLAAVSHELRTPLGHMRLLAELGKPKGLDIKQLTELEREIVEMDDLVDQLLATSRLNFDLRDTRQIDSTALIIESVERAGLDLTVIDIEDDGQILGDTTLLHRALANLIHNAAEHGGGVERVAAQRRADRLILMVEDCGPGLPHAERQKLFEPFVQSADGKQATGKGKLGLGLFLVRRIALAHGAEIIAEDTPSGGARVGLSFMLAELM